MTNPRQGRVPVSASEIDDILDGATSVVKRQGHPLGATLKIENGNIPGKPFVVVDEANGQRIIKVVKKRAK